jgi:hypothetical protein
MSAIRRQKKSKEVREECWRASIPCFAMLENSMMRLMWMLIAVVFALASCGPKPSSTEPDLKDRPFDYLNQDERIAYMKEVVVPAMEPMFREHDPEKFKDFGCRTCHGDSVDSDTYTMPNEQLPKLGGDLTKQFKPEDLDFMLTEIKPNMARLLKTQEWTPADPHGLDCYTCHVRDK